MTNNVSELTKHFWEGEIDSDGTEFIGPLEHSINCINTHHEEHKKRSCQLIATQILNVAGIALLTIGTLYALSVLNTTISEVSQTALFTGAASLVIGLCVTFQLYSAQKSLKKLINDEVTQLYQKYTSDCIIVKKVFIKEEFSKEEQEAIDKCISGLPNSNLRIRESYSKETTKDRLLEYQVTVEIKVALSGGRVTHLRRKPLNVNFKRDDNIFEENYRKQQEVYKPWIMLFRDLVLNHENIKVTDAELNCVLALSTPTSSRNEKPLFFINGERQLLYDMNYDIHALTVINQKGPGFSFITNIEEMKYFLKEGINKF